MGEVLLAEQTEPVRRLVALKLIRAGMYDVALILIEAVFLKRGVELFAKGHAIELFLHGAVEPLADPSVCGDLARVRSLVDVLHRQVNTARLFGSYRDGLIWHLLVGSSAGAGKGTGAGRKENKNKGNDNSVGVQCSPYAN